MDVISKLEALLSNGNCKVRMVTKTSPKLLKKGRETKQTCPYTQINRVVSRLVEVGKSYEDQVNSQRKIEGKPQDFHAETLWNGKGKHVPGSPFLVFHSETGKRYIAIRYLQGEGEFWQTSEGKVINPSELKEFLPIPSEGNRQELNNPIAWRVVALENVLSVEEAK